jgi:hypothetical protein
METTAVAKPGSGVNIIFTLDTKVVSSWLLSNAGRHPDLEHVRLQFLNNG